MNKTIFKALWISLGIVLLIPTSIFTMHTSQSAAKSCGHFVVYLHEFSPATSNCLDTTQHFQKMSPHTALTDCGPGALHIFNNANLDASNGDVCFIGTGFVNLTKIQGPWWWNPLNASWNDKTSSYNTGCTSGTFYSDINGNGSHQNFPKQESENFNSLSHLYNDTLSSISITTSQC